MGGSPGLVVMGGDSCSKGCGYESRRLILDGHDIFTLICCQNCIVCLKRLKINEKRGWSWPIFYKKYWPNCIVLRNIFCLKYLESFFNTSHIMLCI